MKTHFAPSPRITRRAALARVGKLGLLAGALGPAALRVLAADTRPEFKFIVVNDTHYMSEPCGTYLGALVKQMNGEGAALCLHAGDVTDLGTPAHEEAVRGVFARLDMPFHCVPGNHDWLTPTDRSGYENAFPHRLNYSFTHGGWQFIALDSTEGQKYEKTKIQPATFTALDGILAKLDRQKPTVVFTHFPLCENVKMRPLNAEELLVKLKGWNVRAMFSGHFHGFTECERDGVPVTTNRCCALKRNNHDGSKEKGYFVCETADGKLTRRFVEFKGA
jgi:3',5'-cyclic AMP phosphodiesterase CpdA